MTRTAARPTAARKTGSDLEAWLLGEAELDVEAVTLLAAYRDAAAASVPEAQAVRDEVAAPGDGEGTAPAPMKVVPGVPRLRAVEGIEAERLAPLHGQLLAAGFLTSDLLGRSDGLAYRVTREGLRRLAGETAEGAEAEAA